MVNSAKSVDSALSQIQQIFTQAQTYDYVGEPSSQAEHALQAAARASNSGDNEVGDRGFAA